MKNKNMQVLHSSPKTKRTLPAAGFATGLCFYKLLWIFLAGCVIGCLVEMLWCYLNEGFFENRQGLIYGPFSPVYGLGAVLFTLVMYRFKHSSSFIIFLVSTVVGALFEYVCSWMQEMAFGTVSWEYSNEPLNLNGRTSLSFAVMWGVLGLVFMKHVLPFLEQHIERFPIKAGTIITWVLIVLMVFDIVISAAAVRRQTDRHNGVPSTNIITEFLDNHYPDSFLKLIYPNMEQPGRG